MTKQTHGKGFYKVNEYHADVPFQKRPKTIGEKEVDGVKYYIGEGKEYRKDLFDQMFKPNYVASGQSLD